MWVEMWSELDSKPRRSLFESQIDESLRPPSADRILFAVGARGFGHLVVLPDALIDFDDGFESGSLSRQSVPMSVPLVCEAVTPPNCLRYAYNICVSGAGPNISAGYRQSGQRPMPR